MDVPSRSKVNHVKNRSMTIPIEPATTCSISILYPSSLFQHSTIHPSTALTLAIALSLALFLASDQTYMSFLRTLLGTRPASTMVKKTPPRPTVPSAIKSAENLVPGEGGECFDRFGVSSTWMDAESRAQRAS